MINPVNDNHMPYSIVLRPAYGRQQTIARFAYYTAAIAAYDAIRPTYTINDQLILYSGNTAVRQS